MKSTNPKAEKLFAEMNLFGPYTAQGIRKCAGNEGHAYSYSLCRDGKKVAEVQNDGNGGMNSVEWLPRVVFGGSEFTNAEFRKQSAANAAALQDHLSTLPEQTYPEEFGGAEESRKFRMSEDHFLSLLFETNSFIAGAEKAIRKGHHVILCGGNRIFSCNYLPDEKEMAGFVKKYGEAVHLNAHPLFAKFLPPPAPAAPVRKESPATPEQKIAFCDAVEKYDLEFTRTTWKGASVFIVTSRRLGMNWRTGDTGGIRAVVERLIPDFQKREAALAKVAKN